MNIHLGGRYKLLNLLGEGGTSRVYRALDIDENIERAVKVLDQSRDSSATLRRFAREAETLFLLQHPNILTVHHACFEDPAYIVMDLCGSTTLETRAQQGPLAPFLAVSYAVLLLDALHHAHLHGIVHRDVKPANVLFGAGGQPVLADFGLAHVHDPLNPPTMAGQPMGTFAYIAPEQRLDASQVTPSADLYALCAMLFQLITGKSPIDLFATPRHSSRWNGVPPALAAILQRGTRYDPKDRHTDALALKRELVRCLPTLFMPRPVLPFRQSL